MFLLLCYLLFGFIVFCSDHVHENEQPFWAHLVRSCIWPYIVLIWLTHRTIDKLARMGAIIWFLLTTGWLISLLHDRTTLWPFLSYFMLALTTYCVDFMSYLHNNKFRRLLRALCWPKALYEYFKKWDSIPLIQASITIWLFLTTGWLLSLLSDKLKV